MLWLAVHLPRFAVEVCAAPAPAVTVAAGRVLAADAGAEAAGIRPGMRLGSALGLAPGLSVCAPAPASAAAALQTLACWAGQFSPHLSLAPPHELLLEIGGCLRLFGGLDALLARIAAGCEEQAYTFRLGLAPTPLAAQWLARAGAPLRATLAPLPLAVLGLEARPARQFATLGVKRLADLLALPRAGLARRFGPELPRQLAQALGEVPDPRPAFAFPEHFAQGLELPAKVERADMLLFAARRLLLALAGWLQARAAGLRACRLVLVHEDRPPTTLDLAFASPTRDPERLQRVLRERLERLPLAAPVDELRLEVEAVEALPGSTAGLFGDTTGEAFAPVMERLRARLGQEAVYGLGMVADHRPEQATRPLLKEMPGRPQLPCTPSGGGPPAPVGPRPLGLLPAPRPLAECDGAPSHGGRLRLLSRAERIESGWWDGGEGTGDQRRDYFVAVSPQGEWLWIFRDGQGWWLHGYFA